MNKSELIKKLEKELQSILDMFEVSYTKDIHEKPYRWRANAIISFLEDIKNLNEETVKREKVSCLNNWPCDDNHDGICKRVADCEHKET